MKIFFKIISPFFLATSLLFILNRHYTYRPRGRPVGLLANNPAKVFSEESTRLKAVASGLRKYITAKYYNPRICFMIDMKVASGKKRFFVYDIQKDSLLFSGLVAHGSCDNGFQAEAYFSNNVNSGCSCRGKFRIGSRYNGRFGLAYKLYGLDSSNSNASRRAIVLHSYECIPEEEIYPLPICNSRGCAMVSPATLKKIKSYLENSGKPVLLNIFN